MERMQHGGSPICYLLHLRSIAIGALVLHNLYLHRTIHLNQKNSLAILSKHNLPSSDVAMLSHHRTLPNSTLPNSNTKHHKLLILLRTGSSNSTSRVLSINQTWASRLADGQLRIMEGNERCHRKYGDNHWKGLTCLEATNHIQIMNDTQTNFTWLLIVDDDTYVVVDRLTNLLDRLDPHQPAAFGAPGCGNCGKNRTGFCGGGGYFISRKNLLRMAGLIDRPVILSVAHAFIEHFMQEPDSVWCDVRFGCVAQDIGLRLINQPGLYGNPLNDENEEKRIIRLEQDSPPLVFHKVVNASHMHRIHDLVVEMTSKNGTWTGIVEDPDWPTAVQVQPLPELPMLHHPDYTSTALNKTDEETLGLEGQDHSERMKCMRDKHPQPHGILESHLGQRFPSELKVDDLFSRGALKGAECSYEEHGCGVLTLDPQPQEGKPCVREVPKLIHFIWLDHPLPTKYAANIARVMEVNPDRLVMLWVNEAAKNVDKLVKMLNINGTEGSGAIKRLRVMYIDEYKDRFLNWDIIQNQTNVGARSDWFRLEVVYWYGGIYMDTDAHPVHSFSDYGGVFRWPFVTYSSPEGYGNLCNCLWSAEKQSPFLRMNFEGWRDAYFNYSKPSGVPIGCGVMTAAFITYNHPEILMLGQEYMFMAKDGVEPVMTMSFDSTWLEKGMFGRNESKLIVTSPD